MSANPTLRLVDEGSMSADTPGLDQPRAEPKVFARSISAPPGAPWDQSSAADLEARLGAPLPLSELSYSLRRLEPWRFGRPARFAAFYVRTQEVGEELITTADLDGELLSVRFLSPGARARRAGRLGVIALATGIAVALFVGGTGLALAAKAQTEARLSELEQMSAARVRQAQARDRTIRESRALDAAGADGRDVKVLLGDLTWASNAKAPRAHIQALHWDRGYMALEVEGDAAPFGQTERLVQRSNRPIRPGVWLWGVGPASASPNSAEASR